MSADIIALALAEDLGHAGDVTAAATIPRDTTARARVVARTAGVVAGLDAVQTVFAAVDERVHVQALCADGERVDDGAVLAELGGPARSLVTGERTALNLVGHLSGVATLTARFVAAVAGTGAVIRDTRKTLPGLRVLQKAAVAAGGGANHRLGLFDGLLVKDNHVAAAGGVAVATRAALGAAAGLPVQIEVDDLVELDAVLAAGAPCVLLDNFALADLRSAVERCVAAGVFTEASGGITLDTVRAVAETGVDAIAVGALTHSAPALDIGLDFAVTGEG